MDTVDRIRDTFRRHQEAVERSTQLYAAIARGSEIIRDALQSGHKVLICGNGGSAADAQHFAAEWVIRYQGERRPLPVVALTTDTSALTAAGNDYGFDQLFVRAVQALGQRGDVLIAISTSGRSANIRNALAEARRLGLTSMLMTGIHGAESRDADLVLAVPLSETARIQEVHELILHTWAELGDVWFGPAHGCSDD